MSSRNDEIGIYAILLIVFSYVAMAFFAYLVFIAAIFTLLSLIALIRPVRIGSYVVEPEDAKVFIGRGLLGAAFLPTFIAFSSWFLEYPFNPDHLFYLITGGYVAGSLGSEFFDDEDESPSATQVYLPEPPKAPSAPQKELEHSNVMPFKFADWNDEGKDQ